MTTRFLLWLVIPATVIACYAILDEIKLQAAMDIRKPLPATLPSRYRVTRIGR